MNLRIQLPVQGMHSLSLSTNAVDITTTPRHDRQQNMTSWSRASTSDDDSDDPLDLDDFWDIQDLQYGFSVHWEYRIHYPSLATCEHRDMTRDWRHVCDHIRTLASRTRNNNRAFLNMQHYVFIDTVSLCFNERSPSARTRVHATSANLFEALRTSNTFIGDLEISLTSFPVTAIHLEALLDYIQSGKCTSKLYVDIFQHEKTSNNIRPILSRLAHALKSTVLDTVSIGPLAMPVQQMPVVIDAFLEDLHKTNITSVRVYLPNTASHLHMVQDHQFVTWGQTRVTYDISADREHITLDFFLDNKNPLSPTFLNTTIHYLMGTCLPSSQEYVSQKPLIGYENKGFDVTFEYGTMNKEHIEFVKKILQTTPCRGSHAFHVNTLLCNHTMFHSSVIERKFFQIFIEHRVFPSQTVFRGPVTKDLDLFLESVKRFAETTKSEIGLYSIPDLTQECILQHAGHNYMITYDNIYFLFFFALRAAFWLAALRASEESGSGEFRTSGDLEYFRGQGSWRPKVQRIFFAKMIYLFLRILAPREKKMRACFLHHKSSKFGKNF